MPTYAIPPDNRAVGTGNPPGDMNQVSDMLGLLSALLSQISGYPGNSSVPASNVTNVSILSGLLGVTPVPPLPNSTDWINATHPAYGADPSGALDSTTAINSALSAAATGQPVYLPAGVYKTSAPVVIPPAGVLIGDYANEVSTYLDYVLGTVIRPTSSWASSAAWNGVISLVGQTAGGYSKISEEQKITGISLDCHNIPGTSVDGIQAYGDPSRFHLSRIMIGHAPRHAFSTVADGGGNSPGAYRLNRVVARYAGTYGFLLNKTSDVSVFDCMAENCGSDGFNLTNLSNGMMIGCRAEHNGTAGAGNGLTYTNTNPNTGSGTVKLIAFSTDRNEAYGIQVTSSNSSGVPVQLVGCQVRRDGRNSNTGGGGFAGIYVNAFPGTVLISGTAVWPGVDDTGSGTNSPQIGMKLAANSSTHTYVTSAASYFQGATTGISDDGTCAAVYYGPDVLAATGTTGTPAVLGPRQGNATLTGGTVTVACTSVTATSRIFLTSSSTSANQGRLYVSALTPGTSFAVTSSNALDATTFVWQIMNP